MKLRDLKEKLEGVYDLGNPEDCQKIIEMLLRDLDESHERADGNSTKLKMLAYLVAKDRPNARDKAEEVLSGVPKKTKSQMWDMLMGMTNEIVKAEGLDNEELLDEVTSRIWGDLHMDSRESAVLEELIRRFKERDTINAVPDKVS